MSMISAIVSCSLYILLAAGSAWGQEGLKVSVSILPQKYFVEQIGRDKVEVDVMVRPAASPHTYEPKASQMVALSKSKLYFSTGVTFEKAWLKKISSANPGLKIVRTDKMIEKIPMIHHEQLKDHDHGGHSHREGEPDPHIWLSPPLVLIQARHILTALQGADPKNYDFYESNYRAFASVLLTLDADLRNTFKGKAGTAFMVYHPAWGYFAETYGLRQLPIEIEGKEPKPAQLKEMVKKARDRGVKVIFIQPQFSARSAEQVAGELGGRVIIADPLALDWAKNLREVAERFGEALR